MKRVISLLLSLIMVASIGTGIDFTSNAAEGSAHLSEDDIMWFTNKFLYTLTESEKATYGDVLKKMSPDVEWSGSEYEKFKFCIEKLQGYWGKVSPFLPSSITDSELAKLGGKACDYFTCTIGVLKNLYYVNNVDNNNIEKAYHYLKSFNSICSTLGWSLGPLAPILAAITATFPIAEILYSGVCTESLQFYETELQMEYWDPTHPDFTTPDQAMLKPAFQPLIKDEKYEQGLDALYIKYTLMRMSDNIKNITVDQAVSEKFYYGGHTYQVINTSMTWSNAKEYCDRLGGHLASVTSKSEDESIFEFVVNSGYSQDEYWVGGSDESSEGDWHWTTDEKWEYSHWGTGEPDNYRNIQHYLCVCIREKSGASWKCNVSEWDDVEDDPLGGLGFVCEWDDYVDTYPTMNDEHHYDTTVVNPTCTADGYTVNKCKDCDLKYYTNNVPKLGHNLQYTKTVAPTCTANGYELYSCSRCNYTEKRNQVAALGHDYVLEQTVEPTCTEGGYELYKCSVCGATEKRNAKDATGHNYTVISNTATCTEGGIKTSKCVNCGDIKAEDSSAFGHKFNISYDSPSCIVDGGYTYTCSVCGFVKRDVYKATGHDYGLLSGKEYIDFVESTSNRVLPERDNEINEYYHTCEMYFLRISVQNEIRVDRNNLSEIENYQFTGKNRRPLFTNKARLFTFGEFDSIDGDCSDAAIPYTDKEGNLLNPDYVDYLKNGEWHRGKYTLTDGNQVLDENGAVICEKADDIRTHISFTKDEAHSLNITNEDGKVSINNLDSQYTGDVFYSAGIPGVYFSNEEYNFSNNRRLWFNPYKVDTHCKEKPKAGVYNISVGFFIREQGDSINTKIKIYDKDKLVKREPATETKDEKITYTCFDCGDTKTETTSLDIKDFKIKSVSLALESSITMNFKVSKSAVSDFENPYMEFTCGNKKETVTEYAEQGDYLVFSYKGISPQLMNDDVVAVLHAEHNGIDYKSPKKVMSIKTYAYAILDKYNSDSYAKLRTLMVDLLNYGAAAQAYIGYEENDLVNSALTQQQKQWASTNDRPYENIRDYSYKTISSPSCKWVSGSLVLGNSVTVRAKFSADNIENKTVVVTCGNAKFEYTKEDFISCGNGYYYVYCDEIYANEMSKELYFTVYENGIQCSNTMRYSIESYAKLVKDAYPDTAIEKMISAMMRYGDSAKAYGL